MSLKAMETVAFFGRRPRKRYFWTWMEGRKCFTMLWA